ncbi:hypothetical protein GCM10009540_53840 [Streptomyces turgidiscabies]
MNHAASAGIWLKLRKEGPGIAAPDYPQAPDTTLCHGWIDAQQAGPDDERRLRQFTPRRARSRWSKVNRDKVTALVEQGRMRPAGRRRSTGPGPTAAGKRRTTARGPPRCRTASRRP